MKALNGTGLGLELLKVLGLEKIERVRGITIHIPVDDVVTIDITQVMIEDQADELKEVLTKYVLYEKK